MADQPWPVLLEFGAGPVPDWVAPPLAAVLRDFQRPTPVPVSVGWSDDDDDGWSRLWLRELGETSATGVSIYGTKHESLLEQLAEQLQDQFFHETLAAWGEARPQCPGHAHPLAVDMRRGQAWWRCPASNEWVARVGYLCE